MAYYERTYRLGFGGGLTTSIKYLLIANGAIFVLQQFIPSLIDWFGLHPRQVIGSFFFWQLFSYMFLHGGPLHLIFNMLFLWMFGGEVERTLGSKEFMKYYLICGVGGAICNMIFNFDASVVGASGAIFGVMAAFAVLFPERIVTLLLFLILPVQIKAKYLVMGLAALQLLLIGTNDGIAYFAHLGGMAVGFIYLKMDWRLEYVGGKLRQHRESRRAVQKLKKDQAIQRIRERVDEILDKINEVGYDRLDDEEKRTLQEASERLGQEKETEN